MNPPTQQRISDLAVQAFSDPHRTFLDATRDLDRRTANAVAATAGLQQESAFEQGIMLKGVIDKYEVIARTTPSEVVLAVLLNCEVRLWWMYKDMGVRRNPFLVHWVETVMRLEGSAGTRGAEVEGGVTREVVERVRVECVKRILMESGGEGKGLMGLTPRELLEDVLGREGVKTAAGVFEVKPFVDMLVEDGIYDKPEESAEEVKTDAEEQSDSGHQSMSKQKSLAVDSKSMRSAQDTTPGIVTAKQWKQEIHQKLDCEREATLQDLTRLPLELPFLDFLNEMLDKQVLQAHGVNPAPTITGYIQHSLRIIEKMGSPSPAAHHNTGESANANEGIHEGDMIWEYGKEAQNRSVVLLLLFIKNLIRKNLLEPEVLYFEIQEICVRYVWIKEVRAFRAWVEEGVERG